MERGYVILWRKMLDSSIMQNPKLCHFWIWCLMKATHKSIKRMVGYTEVCLDPGEFIFGRKVASKETGLSERSIRTVLRILENQKKVQKSTSKSTRRFSVIKIINWDTYQNLENKSTIKSTTKRPRGDHEVTTNNTHKHINNNNKKNIYKKKDPKFDSEIEKFVSGFMGHIQDTYPNLAPKGKQSFLTGCDVVDKLIRLDGFSLDYVIKVMRFAVYDEYSAKYNTSLATLRTKKNGASDITKFQKIAMSYESKNKQSEYITINSQAAVDFLKEEIINESK